MNPAPGLNRNSRNTRHRLQDRDVRLNLFAVLIVEAEELDSQPQAFSDVGHSGHGYHSMLIVWQLEAHHHSRSSTYWLLGADEQTAGADIGHVFSNSRRTATAVCELKFNLGANGGTLETSSFKLSGTSHVSPSCACVLPWVSTLRLLNSTARGGRCRCHPRAATIGLGAFNLYTSWLRLTRPRRSGAHVGRNISSL